MRGLFLHFPYISLNIFLKVSGIIDSGRVWAAALTGADSITGGRTKEKDKTGHDKNFNCRR